MSTLDTLAAYVAANSTHAVGTDLFKNQFPATAPDTAVAIYESGGVAPARSFSGVVFESPSVQVVSRSTAYATARLNAQVVWNIIEGITNESAGIDGKAQQSPFSIGSDDSDRYQVSCNYFIEKEVSST